MVQLHFVLGKELRYVDVVIAEPLRVFFDPPVGTDVFAMEAVCNLFVNKAWRVEEDIAPNVAGT